MIESEGALVHWDRHIVLHDVWVVDFGAEEQGCIAPLDLYVSFTDWSVTPRADGSVSPLGQLAQLVLQGATVLNERRAPKAGHDPISVKVTNSNFPPKSDGQSAKRLGAVATAESESLNAAALSPTLETLEREILSRFPEQSRASNEVQVLVKGLLARAMIFGELGPTEATTVVEFEVLHEPKPASFQARRSRHVTDADYQEQLSNWERLKQIQRVSWDTPAYRFGKAGPRACVSGPTLRRLAL